MRNPGNFAIFVFGWVMVTNFVVQLAFVVHMLGVLLP